MHRSIHAAIQQICPIASSGGPWQTHYSHPSQPTENVPRPLTVDHLGGLGFFATSLLFHRPSTPPFDPHGPPSAKTLSLASLRPRAPLNQKPSNPLTTFATVQPTFQLQNTPTNHCPPALSPLTQIPPPSFLSLRTPKLPLAMQ